LSSILAIVSEDFLHLSTSVDGGWRENVVAIRSF